MIAVRQSFSRPSYYYLYNKILYNIIYTVIYAVIISCSIFEAEKGALHGILQFIKVPQEKEVSILFTLLGRVVL